MTQNKKSKVYNAMYEYIVAHMHMHPLIKYIKGYTKDRCAAHYCNLSQQTGGGDRDQEKVLN